MFKLHAIKTLKVKKERNCEPRVHSEACELSEVFPGRASK
jgi:hypothetical protein